MGDVKDAVKGDGSKRKPTSKAQSKSGKNLIDDIVALKDEISELTAKKDQDAEDEGDDAKQENLRKAGLLRAVHSLLVTAERILEMY